MEWMEDHFARYHEGWVQQRQGDGPWRLVDIARAMDAPVSEALMTVQHFRYHPFRPKETSADKMELLDTLWAETPLVRGLEPLTDKGLQEIVSRHAEPVGPKGITFREI